MSIVHNEGAADLYGLGIGVICAVLGLVVSMATIFAHTAHAADAMWMVGL